jgi:MoxR-like ATPase
MVIPMNNDKKKDLTEIQEALKKIYGEMEDTISTFGNSLQDGELSESTATFPDAVEEEVMVMSQPEYPDPIEPIESEPVDPEPDTPQAIEAEDFIDLPEHTVLARIKDEVSKAVVGYEDIVEDLLIALVAGGHVLLEGYPGVAKTTLAKAFTATLGVSYNRIQFTPDMLPQDITGHFFYNQKIHEFEVRKGPIFTNILLADEINRTTAKTQSALLEAMQEGQVTIEGRTFPLPSPFMIIATINPLESEGVYAIPRAQSDRFAFKLEMGYVGRELELSLLKLKHKGTLGSGEVLRQADYASLMDEYKVVHVGDDILAYIRDIIYSSRDSTLFSMGASPRAGEIILRTAKARACIRNRRYVIPDDVKYVCRRALKHRLVPAPDYADSDVSIESLI